jgi:hypothetical protein
MIFTFTIEIKEGFKLFVVLVHHCLHISFLKELFYIFCLLRLMLDLIFILCHVLKHLLRHLLMNLLKSRLVVQFSLIQLLSCNLTLLELRSNLLLLISKEVFSILNLLFNLILMSLVVLFFFLFHLILSVNLLLDSLIFILFDSILKVFSLLLSLSFSCLSILISLRFGLFQCLISLFLCGLNLLLLVVPLFESLLFLMIDKVLVSLALGLLKSLSLILQLSSWSVHSSGRQSS